MNRKSRRRLLIASVVIVVVFAAGVVVLVQRQGAYYRQVSELAAGGYVGRNVKVGGRVLEGVTRDASGAHFVIQDLTGKADTVAVTYSGQMPSAFAVGADVVVIGRYGADGTITADQLQTRCPSKYRGLATTPSARPGQ